jgi:hypothetical protein
MNILVIYTKYPGALGEYWVKWLQRMGATVHVFDSQLAPRWISLDGISLPLGRNISILDVVKKCQPVPDLILHIDGALRHLKVYKKLDIPKVFYAIDSHLTLNFHRNIIHDFDIVFAAQKDCIPKLKEIKEQIFWLPLACDPDVHKKHEIPKLFDIGFVGSVDIRYVQRINLLKKLYEKYDVLASNVKYTNMSKIYSQSKIGFNKSLRSDLNMRVFEVMSSGTMLLTDRISNGMEELFKNKKHLVLYNDEKEMLDLAEYYLRNEEERERIARAGQKEVQENHTYDHRAKEMLKVIKNYI